MLICDTLINYYLLLIFNSSVRSRKMEAYRTLDTLSSDKIKVKNFFTNLLVTGCYKIIELPQNRSWLVVLVFYGPSILFRPIRARSVNLSILFLCKPPKQFTST